jgi:hypothetical protein
MILTQLYLVVSGNYAWLNWLTILAAAAAIGDVVVPRPILELFGLTTPRRPSRRPRHGSRSRS